VHIPGRDRIFFSTALTVSNLAGCTKFVAFVVILHIIGKKALQIVKPNIYIFCVLFMLIYDKNYLHKITFFVEINIYRT